MFSYWSLGTLNELSIISSSTHYAGNIFRIFNLFLLIPIYKIKTFTVNIIKAYWFCHGKNHLTYFLENLCYNYLSFAPSIFHDFDRSIYVFLNILYGALIRQEINRTESTLFLGKTLRAFLAFTKIQQSYLMYVSILNNRFNAYLVYIFGNTKYSIACSTPDKLVLSSTSKRVLRVLSLCCC